MPATLLLADDSVTIQRVIQLTFQNEDIRVIATSDGESAIQRIDAEPPDIVLADVGMPKQDGYAVSAHVKRTPLLRQIPVLLLTGAFEPVDEDKARASGCDGVLVKPFEPQQLVGRVKELLAARKRGPERRLEMPMMRPAPSASAPAAPLPTPVAFAPKIAEPQPQPPQAAPRPVQVPPPPPVPQAAPPPKPTPVPNPAAPAAAAGHVPPDMEASFQREFDQLDAAFAQLDPEPAAAALDDETASDFARDLHLYRNTGEPGPANERTDDRFGNWDLPNMPPVEPPLAAPPVAARAVPRPVGPRSIPPELPEVSEPLMQDLTPRQEEVVEAPVYEQAPVEVPMATRRVSMAGAFAALLAAEQALPGAPTAVRPAQMSEATVEEVVRRVLARMTDDTVKRIVHDTAERLIREEIEKIKGQ
jgi:CheY-like chemotaxis protein